jgi:hypothetical protein
VRLRGAHPIPRVGEARFSDKCIATNRPRNVVIDQFALSHLRGNVGAQAKGAGSVAAQTTSHSTLPWPCLQTR